MHTFYVTLMAPPDRRSRADSHVVVFFSRDLDIGFDAVIIELESFPFPLQFFLRVLENDSAAISGSFTPQYGLQDCSLSRR
jgi:hypothetical protein